MYSWAVVPSKHQQKRGTSKESVLKNVTWKYIYLLFILEATKASSFAQPCSGLKLLSIILLTWAMPKTLPVFSWIVISWSLTHRIRNSGYVRSVSWFSSIYSASSYYFSAQLQTCPVLDPTPICRLPPDAEPNCFTGGPKCPVGQACCLDMDCIHKCVKPALPDGK